MTSSLRGIPKLTLTAAGSNSGPLLDEGELAIQTWPDLYGNVFAYCYSQGDTDWIELPGLADFGFSRIGEEVKAVFCPSVSTELVQETYYRSVLPMIVQARGTEVLHSSAVLMPQGVIALCGKSWSGKSTTAYALSQRGYPLWADDAVAFDTAGEQVTTAPLPFRIQLRPASVSFFDPLRPAPPATGALAHFDQTNQEPAILAALCILKPASPDASLNVETCPLSSAQAFAAVLSHAYCFSLHHRKRKRQMMQRYLDLTARVPAFEIRYKPGLEKLSAVLDGIESCVDRLCKESTLWVTQSCR